MTLCALTRSRVKKRFEAVLQEERQVNNSSCKHDIILFLLPFCAILENSTGGLIFMTFNYNKLWKLLIDKRMTKTQMRLKAGISTNILAKMGKGEPVAMESLAKIATALNCELDDIVEIEKGGE